LSIYQYFRTLSPLLQEKCISTRRHGDFPVMQSTRPANDSIYCNVSHTRTYDKSSHFSLFKLYIHRRAIPGKVCYLNQNEIAKTEHVQWIYINHQTLAVISSFWANMGPNFSTWEYDDLRPCEGGLRGLSAAGLESSSGPCCAHNVYETIGMGSNGLKLSWRCFQGWYLKNYFKKVS
jgi:hypothetical protein